MVKFMISVGDISGDRFAAEIVARLRKISSDIQFFGLGGEALKNIGVDCWADLTKFSSIGMFEPLRYIIKYIKLYFFLKNQIKSSKPDILLCVDAQGLNLIVAKLVKQFNIPVLYYIAPQEWHWGTKKGGQKSS